jgi:hypothetical protein
LELCGLRPVREVAISAASASCAFAPERTTGIGSAYHDPQSGSQVEEPWAAPLCNVVTVMQKTNIDRFFILSLIRLLDLEIDFIKGALITTNTY